MSERAPHYEGKNYDPNPYGERPKAPEQDYKKHEAEPAASETIEHILKKIEREAHSGKEVLAKQEQHDRRHENTSHLAGSHLKSHAARQTINSVQKQLSPPERTFSKFVHNPAVESISEAAGKTVARPTGLLWGGIFSVIGSLAVIIITRFYGYEYNYVIGLACFAGGFFIGLIIELLFKSRRS